MAVPGPQPLAGGDNEATARLRALLDGTSGPRGWLMDDPLPAGVRLFLDEEAAGAAEPEPPAFGYTDPRLYLDGRIGAASLNRTHAEALAAEDFPDYCAQSADITMRGGTTSGIVYPLAVCEIARAFRLRNLGGASAGAIAASAAAAAELGRIRAVKGIEDREHRDKREGVARGFAGLAEVTQWLAQTAERGPRDEFRVAGLFQPMPGEPKVFRFLKPLMQGTGTLMAVFWALYALGRFWRNTMLVVGAISFSLLVFALPPARVPGLDGVAADVVVAVAGAAGAALIVFGAVELTRGLLAQGAQARRARTAREWSGDAADYYALRTEKTSARPDTRATGWRNWPVLRQRRDLAILVLGVALAVAVFLTSGLTGIAVTFAFAALIVLAVATVLVLALMRMNRDFGPVHHYGLLTGKRLIDWLDHRLRDLSGQDTPLTFGQLWWLRRPNLLAKDPAVDDPRHRLVNLQLVTTDLAQQRPFLFPLPDDSELKKVVGSEFYVDADDVARIFPEDVRRMLIRPGSKRPIRVWENGKLSVEPRALYKLPQPWDMPVVFGVRASMALPGLFKALRIYRLRRTTTVRDEFGRKIGPRDGARPFRSPTLADGDEIAEELWLSDGGITSNFPVHLFDLPLPKWPTFGLNLGPHSLGFEHQDVWFPEDWQAGAPPLAHVGPSLSSFLVSIVTTARAWRDVLQTGMTSTRGRVAWVRQRPDEGGTNLYMPKGVIASMSLRGALAGARIRHRYTVENRWPRHQWLRLRTALPTLDAVRDDLLTARVLYTDLFDRDLARAAAVPNTNDGTPNPFWPDHAYWLHAKELFEQLSSGPPERYASLRKRDPRPAPEFRLSPRM